MKFKTYILKIFYRVFVSKEFLQRVRFGELTKHIMHNLNIFNLIIFKVDKMKKLFLGPYILHKKLLHA